VPLNIPTGETVFLDANIFYYHFVSLPGLSIACKNFLHRIEQGEITGVTATVVLAEAQHKVMLAEAVQKYGLSPQGLVRRLTQTTGLLAGLSHHRIVPSTVVAMNVRIEPLNHCDIATGCPPLSHTRIAHQRCCPTGTHASTWYYPPGYK